MVKEKQAGSVKMEKSFMTCNFYYVMKSLLFLLVFLVSERFFSQRNYDEDSLRNAERNRFIFEKNKKYGVLDGAGKKLTKPVYNNISYVYNNLFIVTKDTLNGVLNKKGEFVLPLVYKNIDTNIGYLTDSKTFSVEDFNDEGFIYNKNGEKISNLKFSLGNLSSSRENHLAEMILINKEGYRQRKLVKVLDEIASVIEIPGYENEELKGIYLDFEGFQKENVSARDFVRNNNRSVISFYKNHSHVGLFNIHTNKVIPAIYQGLKYDSFSKRIYLLKDKFYSFSVDGHLENPIENNDKIIKIHSDNFFCINGKNNMIIKRNGFEVPFSYPKLEEYHDESRVHYNQISYQDHLYYRNFFKYYLNSDDKKHGLINFQGKILTKAEYDEITLLFYSDDSNYDAVENKKFYEENKIDIVSVAQNILSDGSKKIDVINRKGNTIVTLNLPKNLFLYLSGVKLSHFTKNGNLFLESYSKSDKGHSVDKFYMFNFYTGKLIIETDKAPIFEVSNVGYKTVFHDTDKKVKIITVYNLKAEKIGSYTLKNDWQNNDYENDFDGVSPYKENGKEGLKNFSNEIIVKAVYDKIKAVGNEFYIVIKITNTAFLIIMVVCL
jgi:hypothetical protein